MLLDRITPVLSRTPAALDALLRGLDDGWARSNYGDDTFSPFDVVGHLIHGERADWMPRLRIILEHGERQPFEPFDRYAMYEASKGKTMADLLDEFAALRAANLHALAALHLSEADLARRGMHPELGPATAANLLAAWCAHDLHHVGQIAKCMARQLGDGVGPFREYLGVLTTPLAQ